MFDIRDAMTITERYQWAYGLAVFVTSGAYFGWLGGQLTHIPAGEINCVTPLLWTLLGSVGIHTLGRGFAAHAAQDESRTDERDVHISQRADSLCFLIFSVVAAVPLLLGIASVQPFWITNALFPAFSLTSVVGVGLRVWLYRTQDAA